MLRSPFPPSCQQWGKGWLSYQSGLPGLFPAPGPNFPVKAALEKLIFNDLGQTCIYSPCQKGKRRDPSPGGAPSPRKSRARSLRGWGHSVTPGLYLAGFTSLPIPPGSHENVRRTFLSLHLGGVGLWERSWSSEQKLLKQTQEPGSHKIATSKCQQY